MSSSDLDEGAVAELAMPHRSGLVAAFHEARAEALAQMDPPSS